MTDSLLKICVGLTAIALLLSLFVRPISAGLYPEGRTSPTVCANCERDFCANCQAALNDCRGDLKSLKDPAVFPQTQLAPQGSILNAIWNSLFGTAVEMKNDVRDTIYKARTGVHNLKGEIKDEAQKVGHKFVNTAENLEHGVKEEAESFIHGAQKKWHDAKESIRETGERLREGYHHSNLKYLDDERTAPDMSSYRAQRDFMDREEEKLRSQKERFDKASLENQSLQARAASEVFLPVLIALSIGALLIMSVRRRNRMLINFDGDGFGSDEVLPDETLPAKRIDQPGPIDVTKTRRRAH